MKTSDSHIAPLRIGDRLIGPDLPTYVIAEIGINHNGDPGLARELVNVAADCGADAVKFQKRDLRSLYREDVLRETARYEQHFQYMIPVLERVELSEDDLWEMRNLCLARGVEFLCTPFDNPSVDLLLRMGIKAFKVASADLTNLPLLEYIAAQQRPMIVSTGMSYWHEIEQAVDLLKRKGVPFALLHCRSVYPVWPREVNLRMIDRLRTFGVPVGYSGHDIGITIPLVAASMGACIIEKHVTLDKKMEGPDHKISLEPFELRRLIRDIRVADQAMARSRRFLLRGEILNRELFGKSLVAACAIAAGTRIDREMIAVKGPAKGLSPGRMGDLVGRVVRRDLEKDDYFLEEDLGEGPRIDFSNSFRSRWGLICRFSDMDEMLAYGPKVIEFHLTERDLDQVPRLEGRYPQELVVHAPEYMGELLLDLCSGDEAVRLRSVRLVEKAVDVARSLAPHFRGKPKVIAHPGAMSLNIKMDREPLRLALRRSCEEIRRDGVELLLENLPPYPWYFGGQWKGNYFMDPGEIRAFCEETGIGLCFDLSHAALYCNAKERDLADFIRAVRPFIRHIHFADAYGLDGEGVQVGEGDIEMKTVMPLFSDYQGSWVPEVWRGHLSGGRGFLESLDRLRAYGL